MPITRPKTRPLTARAKTRGIGDKTEIRGNDGPHECTSFAACNLVNSIPGYAPANLKMDYNGIMISGCVAVFVREMCNDY